MSNWTPTTYKTMNWSDYNKALKQRGSLSIWFDAGMVWNATPSGQRGRQQAYSDAAIQACLTIKVLFSLADVFTQMATGAIHAQRCSG